VGRSIVQYRRLIQAYMVRHKIRPGITGWAQANGLRIVARPLKLMLFDRNAF